MDMILKRLPNGFRQDGIFSDLLDDQGNGLFAIGEHAYRQDNGLYLPKIPDGTYVCVRGIHRLIDMADSFETFEITNVPDHTNILWHVGNYPQLDSEGCCLVGSAINKGPTAWMITQSRIAFENFMQLHVNDKTFNLVVSSN
jgi:hypothetical protein